MKKLTVGQGIFIVAAIIAAFFWSSKLLTWHEETLHLPATVISKGDVWGETLNNHDPIIITCRVVVKDALGQLQTLSGAGYCSLKAGDQIK